MNLLTELQEAEEKLEKLLEEENWTMKTEKSEYPIRFTFRKGQMEWDTKNTEAPEIQFIFKADVEYVLSIPEDERIDEKFFRKLSTLAKEVHRLYLLHWFSMKNIRFLNSWTNMYDVCDGKQKVGILAKYYEP
jgi:hypothetical protein